MSLGAGCTLWFVDWSTTVVTAAPLPPLWANTILAGPTPYTHQTVRTPLPYGSPSAPTCVICVRTSAASTAFGKAGTVTGARPR